MSPDIYIFNAYPLRPTDGGPSGFLAQNLAGHPVEGVTLGKFHPWQPKPGWRGLAEHLPGVAGTRRRSLGLGATTWIEALLLSVRQTFRLERVVERPVVWFHDVIALAACLDLLRPTQRIVLQPHCPQLPSEEVREAGWPADDVRWMIEAERTAFQRANLIALPNEGVVKIYEPLLRAAQKIAFLESGCDPIRAAVIPPLDPQFVYYLYLGRRLTIKGWDLVLEGFRAAHRAHLEIRLLVVGNGPRLAEPGVIDLGFSDRPAAWLGAADYLLNVNRQSYFDLGIMEALAEGTPLLMTCSHGHATFATIGSPGIRVIASPSASAVADAIGQNRRKRANNPAAVTANRSLFAVRFSAEHYRTRLTAFVRSPDFLAATA